MTKQPLTKTQKWLYSAGIWLSVIALFAIVNMVIYYNKSAGDIAFMPLMMIGYEAFASMVKLMVVLPVLWVVSIYQLLVGTDSVFRGSELGMTGFLWLTPYVFIPLTYWIMGKLKK